MSTKKIPSGVLVDGETGKARFLRPGEQPPADCKLMICIDASYPPLFSDNKYGTCNDCNRAIQFRPDAPNLTKICVSCLGVREQGGNA